MRLWLGRRRRSSAGDGRFGWRWRRGFRGRGRCRGTAAGTGSRLEFGHALALQLDQLLQLDDVLLELGEPLVRFLEGLVTSQQVLFQGLQAGAVCGAGGACLGRRPGVGLGDANLVLGLAHRTRCFTDLGRDSAAALLVHRRGRWLLGDRRLSQSAAVVGKVGGLRDNLTTGFGRADGLRRLSGRNAENLACPQAIHVAIEGGGIGAKERHQHLVERDPFGARLLGDAIERVAALDAIALWRSHGGTAGGELAGGGRRRRLAHRRLGHCTDRLARCPLGRIEQERVFTDQSPVCPGEFDHHVHKRLVERPVTRDSHHRARATALYGDTDIGQHRRHGHPGLLELARIGDLGDQRLQFVRRGIDRNFGAEWLPQSAEDGQPSHPGGLAR